MVRTLPKKRASGSGPIRSVNRWLGTQSEDHRWRPLKVGVFLFRSSAVQWHPLCSPFFVAAPLKMVFPIKEVPFFSRVTEQLRVGWCSLLFFSKPRTAQAPKACALALGRFVFLLFVWEAGVLGNLSAVTPVSEGRDAGLAYLLVYLKQGCGITRGLSPLL